MAGNQYFDAASYISVEERLATLKTEHPESRVVTAIVAHTADCGRAFVRCEIYLDVSDIYPTATGLAEGSGADGDKWLEKTETVAIGRACANLGMAKDRGTPRMSREEAERFHQSTQRTGEQPATEKQLAACERIARDRGLTVEWSKFTRQEASAFITHFGAARV